MTREEAINIVKYYRDLPIRKDDKKALDMAIKSLDQEPCEDAISREAVIDITWEEPSYTDALNVLTEVRDRVKALPSVNPQEPKWIPVSERLPEPDIEVLVTDDAGGLATISTDRIYECEVTGEKEWYTSQNVTAWMPLPKPYEPQESEEDVFDKIKGYVDHIRNTGMGKKRSLEFIEKFIDGLEAESKAQGLSF